VVGPVRRFFFDPQIIQDGGPVPEVITMRFRGALLVFLSFSIIVLVVCLVWHRAAANRNSAPPDPVAAEGPDRRESVAQHEPTPVALNRGPEVRDGFRGDVHPVLSDRARLEVTAFWTPVGTGRDQLDRTLSPSAYSWFTELRPARAQQTYTARDFSAFLPETVGEVGQVWALDGDKIVGLLKQFHPRASMHLVASGRRAGPDGAFAILRAASPSYLDIVFRIHTEFYLTPDSALTSEPLVRAWYTPAYLSGRLLVNRGTGVVEHFRLALPTDKALNVHLTTSVEDVNEFKTARDIVRVERMELSGGDAGLAETLSWTRALALAEAQRRLAKVFYKFLDIDWVPFDQVLAQAHSRSRPIFAIVSWGSFEDQSC
jgi:hypothetical protein